VRGYGRYQLQIKPTTLIGWMWMRVADDLTSGVRWDRPPCIECGTPMGRGPGGYRADAEYCSDKCRTYFNRRPKSEQRERRKAARVATRKGTGRNSP
jgi:hypothetical protein